ncbi:MAG: hypothetical protein ACI87E_003377 [Mariniblastus sp.]|jgi:hypothetical protein
MTRISVALVLVFFLLSLNIAVAQDNPFKVSENQLREPAAQTKERTEAPAPVSDAQANREIMKKLMASVDFDFDETPWSEIEEYLESNLQLNIILTISAKDDALSEDEPLTFSSSGTSVLSAMRQMLVKHNATVTVQGSFLKIISLDDADDPRYFSNHFYNVRALLDAIREKEQVRLGKPQAPAKPVLSHDLDEEDQADDLFGTGMGMDRVPVTTVTAESMLTDIVTSSVANDSWSKSGKGKASINIVAGYMIVSSSSDVASGVRTFLDDLEYHLVNE